MNEDVRRLVRDLRKIPGVTVQRAGSGHWTVRKEGRLVTSIASTPSDRRAWANMQADLQRGGIDLSSVKRQVRRRKVTPEQIAAAKQAYPPEAGDAAPAEPDPSPNDTSDRPGELSTGPAKAPLPYEEETEISLSAERTPSGWLYTRVRMLVRTERWCEPPDLPQGDPRKKVAAAPDSTGASKATPATARESTQRAPAAAPAPQIAASARLGAERPTEGGPGCASRADQESAVGEAPSAGSESPPPDATIVPPSRPPSKSTTQKASKGQATPPVLQSSAATGGERRRRVAPPPRPIPGRARTGDRLIDAPPPPTWIQGSELPPRNAAEWRRAIPYGTETPVWPTTRTPDEIDSHILLFIEEEAPAPLRDVALQVGRQLGYSPEAIYPRVYRLAREGRVGLTDDSATQRKVVTAIGPGTTDR